MLSSSRCDNVTKCVGVSVFSHFVYFGTFKEFEASCCEGVGRVSQECLFEFSMVIQGSFKGVYRKFQGCFKEV